MNNIPLQIALLNYIENPKNDRVNYELGLQYHYIGNSAAAISFLLRAAELTKDNDLAYTCLLLNALNFRKQGRRLGSYRNQILHAIALCPERPEAYFILSRYFQEYKPNAYETHKYHESYAFAEIGLQKPLAKKENFLLEYNGDYVLLFQKAVAAWWIGKRDESRKLLRDLLTGVKMSKEYVDGCRANLKNINAYTKFEMKTPHNYAQAMQDLFVLHVNKHKREGTYLEIGSADPVYNSNTYLLEKEYDWIGMSIDIDDKACKRFAAERVNPVVCMDAKKVNYETLCKEVGTVIDYLQVDCDPADITLWILKKIPFDKIVFRCVTFEHDAFNEGTKVRDESREHLYKHGYVLVADNIGTDVNSPFEDWWVHHSVLKEGHVKMLVDGESKTPDRYISLY